MKAQLITGHYMTGGDVRLYVRTETGERTYVDIAGFEPYGACRASERIPNEPFIKRVEPAPPDLTNGEKLVKVIYDNPSRVGGHNGYHVNQFYPHWESDVIFTDRLNIDARLTKGIEIPRSKSRIHFDDIIPSDFTMTPVKVGWDIECYSRDRVPTPEEPDQKITALTFWSNVTNHFDSILLDDENKITQQEDNWTIYHLKHEKRVLEMGLKYLAKIQPDILFEWGALDKEYFPPRAKLNDCNTNIFKTFCTFDMIEAYKKIYKRGSNRLKDVAFDEKIIDYIPPEVDFAYLHDHDRMALITKNKHDVEWMVGINDLKKDLVGFFWNLKNYSGLSEIQPTTWHGMLVDNQLLRRYHGKYMLPSRPNREEQDKRKKLIGAIVKDPPVGLFDNIAVLDFSRYYQNLLIGILSQRDDPRLVPLIELAQDLQNVRDEYDKRLEDAVIDSDDYHAIKGVRDSVKYIGEAVIGYLGGKKSRWYFPEAFESVIQAGIDGVLYSEKLCEREGYKSLYYDTDGLDIQMKFNADTQREKLVEESQGLASLLNGELEDWAAEKGIDRKMKLKVDMIARRALYSGKKKRKAFNVVWEDNDFCDYLMVKGFEYIRRDSSLVTRSVQRETFEHLLRKGMDGLKAYLMDVIEKVKQAKYPLRDVALSSNIKHDWDYYSATKVDSRGRSVRKTIPQHVRGAMWSNKYLDARIRKGDQVKLIYVKRTPGYPATNVVSFLDEDIIPENFVIDWEKLIERTIQRKVGEYIAQGGLSWEKVMGMKDLGSVFG